MTASATEINAVYTCAASNAVEAITVDSELVHEFCRCHRVYQRAADTHEDDLVLDELVRLSFRLWYRVLSAPLPLSHPSLIDDSAEDLLSRHVQTVSKSYSELRDVSDRYSSALVALRSSDDNPLWYALEEDLAKSHGKDVGLLIKPARLLSAVRDLAVAKRRRLDVLVESQLRRAVAFDRLYVFGAGRWYPGFVFSAPRAPVLRIVRYGMLSDSPPEEAAFVKPLRKVKRTPFASSRRRGDDASLWIRADEARPAVDIASVMRRAAEGNAAGLPHPTAEVVDVRALFLEQDLAVLVLASEGASELIVDLREEAEKLVHRVQTVNLEPGMAVLVRTEGGGDYIVAAANQIMAEDADELRRHQRYWKRLLSELAEELGPAEVVDRLKGAGSKIANYQNLRNWMSPRSIRTLKREEFDAIFGVIGLAESADRYWDMMAKIDQAHQRAGSLIRRRLLEQVQSADLSPLLSEGRQDFELPGEVGGGSLTAARIVAMSPEVVEAQPWNVHRLIDLAD